MYSRISKRLNVKKKLKEALSLLTIFDAFDSRACGG